MANIRVLPQRTAAEVLWDKMARLTGLDLPPLWSEPAPSRVADLRGEICRSGEAATVAPSPAISGPPPERAG